MAKDSREDEGALIEKYRIFFQEAASKGKLPSHHRQSFQAILDLGSRRFQSYGHDEDGSLFWKAKTKAKTQYLVDTVSKLANENCSEYQWRLSLEPIVFERFERETDCPEPDCKGRWWRSEIEVIPERSGRISSSLGERRKNRRVCGCSAEMILKNINNPQLGRLFSSRADELILHSGEAKSQLNDRRPDRVHGLQQTEHFDRQFEEISKSIQSQITEEAQSAGGTIPIEFTPFKESGRPLMFPFLITEAKHDKGGSFEKCEMQTVFPIWRLLKMQEELQIRAKNNLNEQGGPLVWFFAYRGGEWRLYGCYTDTDNSGNQGQKSRYNILPLWQGRADSRNGALQLLLIVDYIFDWARDLYRTGILQLLKAISSNNFRGNASISNDSQVLSMVDRARNRLAQQGLPPDSAEQISNDSQILSTVDRTRNWLAEPGLPSDSAQNTETNNLPETVLERWKAHDTVQGVFRHSGLIETSFYCLDLRGDFCIDYFNFVPNQFHSQLGRILLQTIFLRASPIEISIATLSYLETQWTGWPRAFDRHSNDKVQALAVIYYNTSISEEWTPRRTLHCIVFDATVLRQLINISLGEDICATLENLQENKLTPLIQAKAQSFSDQDAEALVDLLKAQSGRDIFAASIESIFVSVAKESSGGPRFKFTNMRDDNAAFIIHAMSSFDEHNNGIGLFSSQTEYIKAAPTHPQFIARSRKPQIDTNPLLAGADLRKRLEQTSSGLVLVYSTNIRQWLGKFSKGSKEEAPEWCIYHLGANTEPPNMVAQVDIISNFKETEGFYTVNHMPMNIKVENIWRTFQNGSQDPTQDLLDWKTILTMISEVQEVAKLGVPELSRLCKRVNDENDLGAIVKRARVAAEEAEKEREIIEID